MGAALVGRREYRSRVQATYAPGDWDGLTVRAAWGPSCDGAGVDLEVQASASSVGLLHDVEVMIESQWERSTDRGCRRREQRWSARDARAAALSYDGRETGQRFAQPGDPCASRRLAAISCREPTGTSETEPRTSRWCTPNDVARLMHTRSTEARDRPGRTVALTYGLFGHDFEKGVVFRARLRGLWICSERRVRL